MLFPIGMNFNYIAHWNGTAWATMGTGMTAAVYALAALPNGDVAAGGVFTGAGGIASAYFARYTFGSPPPDISKQPPSPLTICPAGTATFSITAAGNGPLTYQWRRDTTPLSNEPDHITGSATATLMISNALPTDAGAYDCVVSDDCGSVTSTAGTLLVNICCPADIAPPGGNGAVNVDDLLAVINAWGACPDPRDCPADIAPPGGNDAVNVDDLLGVINGWGGCP